MNASSRFCHGADTNILLESYLHRLESEIMLLFRYSPHGKVFLVAVV